MGDFAAEIAEGAGGNPAELCASAKRVLSNHFDTATDPNRILRCEAGESDDSAYLEYSDKRQPGGLMVIADHVARILLTGDATVPALFVSIETGRGGVETTDKMDLNEIESAREFIAGFSIPERAKK